MIRKLRHRVRTIGTTPVAVAIVIALQPLPVASQPLGKTGYERHSAVVLLDNKIEGRSPLTGRDQQTSSISADGRWVAFTTDAPMLSGDNNQLTDVYVQDMKTGAIELASRTVSGVPALGPPDPGRRQLSYQPAMSGDGRHVAFTSSAVNLVPGDTNAAPDAFVYDRRTKVVERISVSSTREQSDDWPLRSIGLRPSMSANGRYVSFTSGATNLVSEDTNGVDDIFVHDRRQAATIRISVGSAGIEANGASLYSSMSGNGRYAAFDSFASNLIEDMILVNGHVFVHDLRSSSTEVVSVASDGSAARPSNVGLTADINHGDAISHDGRFVAFSSTADNLVPNDTNNSRVPHRDNGRDIYVHDRKTGRTERVSVEPDGREVKRSPDIVPSHFQHAAISPDGRYVASNFSDNEPQPRSYFDGLTGNPYVFDRTTGEVDAIGVSQLDNPEAGLGFFSGWVDASRISGGGRYLAVSGEFRTEHRPGCPRGCTAALWADRGHRVSGEILKSAPPSDKPEEDDLICVVDICVPWSRRTSADLASNDESSFSRRGEKLLSATMAVRPLTDDLYLKIEVDRLPGPRGGIGDLPAAGDPTVLYGARFKVEGRSYEVRVSRAGVLGEPGEAVFGLFRCTPECTEVAKLTGGYGTTGESVVTRVPLRHFGKSGRNIGISAHSTYSALGTYLSGATQILDLLSFNRKAGDE